MFIRRVLTKAGLTQIQVMKKVGRQNRLVKHVGTGINQAETRSLVEKAQAFIDQQRIDQGVVSFFDNRCSQTEFERFVGQLEALDTLSTPIYDFFAYYYHDLGFDQLADDHFKDLVICRIIHPVSKARTREWLTTQLNRKVSLTGLYRAMVRAYELNYQDILEELVVKLVRERVDPTIAVLFFDVTTLYYEAFDSDDLRKCGFSKDHKHHQPQIVIALTVTKEGIPLHMKTFEGNKFEGHTMIPCIREVVQKHHLEKLVVVADSAMISQSNMEALEASGLQYIVGARLGNLSKTLFDTVVSLNLKIDGAIKELALPKKPQRRLIVSYSTKRAIKDKSDRNKRLARAKLALSNPTSITNRFKYLKKDRGKQWFLNEKAVAKDLSLEGLKGYVTNTNLTPDQITTKYANLWQVEKSFRISKSDLKARPIFHTVKDKIKAHITIVFTGLAIAKYVELKTGLSTQAVVRQLDRIYEIIFRDKVTQKKFSLHTTVMDETAKQLLKSTNQLWVT